MTKFFRTAPALGVLLGACALTLLPTVSLAEGSHQFGYNQRLVDYQASLAPTGAGNPVYGIDDNSSSQFVDIVAAGEVINVSLCGASQSDDIGVIIYNPSGTQVFSTTAGSANMSCTDNPITSASLTAPFRYTTTATGAYRIQLRNISGTEYGDSYFERWDISVTPNLGTNPNPQTAAGRLYAFSWNMNAPTFADVSGTTDANLYALVPGGRPDTNYIWQLDLNKMAGRGYNIIANAFGVDSPNSGFSTPLTGNSATYLYPVYLSVPVVAEEEPALAPVVTNVGFVDNENEDNGISPGPTYTDGVQDEGTFNFTSDVNGTYAIFVDVDKDNVFGDPDDVFLLGPATVGANSVTWDGRDPNGDILDLGTYNARVAVRLGEYHFVANDIETSGGGVDNGLTIYKSSQSGVLSNTLLYWDDITFLGAAAGGTSTRPDGAVSGTPEGTHTWGNFTTGGFGNERLIDTYVYGLSTVVSTSVVITDNDTNTLIGVDGTITVDEFIARNDVLNITVTDPDLNTGAGAIEQVIVSVVNNATGEIETVTLTETGANTGVFAGVLPTTFAATAGASNSGNMNGDEGDTLTASYEDAQTSGGTQQTRTDTGTIAFDTDGDNVFDPADIDDDNDGIPDASEPAGDFDSDGRANSLDIDADGDGIPDNIEAQPEGNYRAPLGVDTDGDGLDNRYDTDNGGVAITITNTDGTGLADYLDTDADDDGVLDAIEGHDANQNGVADVTPAGADTDNDGLDNAYDTVVSPAAGNANGSNAPLQNTDGDATRDWRDADDDNDTENTVDEDANNDNNWANDDADLDGIPDYLESSITDADGDGTPAELDPNEADACVPDPFNINCGNDTDGDGISNAVEISVGLDPNDADTDNDGLTDGAEVGADGTQGAGETSALDADTDDDGLGDGVEVDGSGPLAPFGATDPLDADTDNDLLNDGLEAGLTSGVSAGVSDGNNTPYGGTVGFVADADPASTTNPNNPDTDGDSLTDGVEDANQNGQTVNTIGGTGTGGTGETNPGVADTDGDGLNDGVEVNGSGPLAAYGATDPLDTDTDDGGTADGTEALADSTN
ncbi:MAG: hypothetical protein KJO82_07385, partial [Gammaproteobacteria bacterium]|nr:hypothetical protein [Gammaproteobacteria bacterium]